MALAGNAPVHEAGTLPPDHLLSKGPVLLRANYIVSGNRRQVNGFCFQGKPGPDFGFAPCPAKALDDLPDAPMQSDPRRRWPPRELGPCQRRGVGVGLAAQERIGQQATASSATHDDRPMVVELVAAAFEALCFGLLVLLADDRCLGRQALVSYFEKRQLVVKVLTSVRRLFWGKVLDLRHGDLLICDLGTHLLIDWSTWARGGSLGGTRTHVRRFRTGCSAAELRGHDRHDLRQPIAKSTDFNPLARFRA